MAAFTPVPPTVKTPVPAVAVIVGVPPQPFPGAVGRADDQARRQRVGEGEPARAGAPAGFVIVKVRTEFCPTPTVVGLNAFVSVGSACTVSVAFTPVVVHVAPSP